MQIAVRPRLKRPEPVRPNVPDSRLTTGRTLDYCRCRSQTCGPRWIDLDSRPVRQMLAVSPSAINARSNSPNDRARNELTTGRTLDYRSFRSQSGRSGLCDCGRVPAFHPHLCPSKPVSFIRSYYKFRLDVVWMSREARSDDLRAFAFFYSRADGWKVRSRQLIGSRGQ